MVYSFHSDRMKHGPGIKSRKVCKPPRFFVVQFIGNHIRNTQRSVSLSVGRGNGLFSTVTQSEKDSFHHLLASNNFEIPSVNS